MKRETKPMKEVPVEPVVKPVRNVGRMRFSKCGKFLGFAD